ncbi:HepT-like ribonuclease domain-containing protein [Methyloferula stellata]|uniref:HepT-like ribonuclease domain-containing protein n=1 Tax=Methyloferula stellata TaxID=876270 RepID=UPI0003685EE7|nr:HepT-like ribonuclease domain-containing protein [Methyloferula stellata]
MTGEKAARVIDYIDHIIEAIVRIENYVNGFDQASFMESTLVQDAVIRNIEIIGEAANKINAVDVTFWETHPNLRLDAAYKMRNSLVHGYSTVNLITVWNTVQNDLPVLKTEMTDLQNRLL